MEDVQKLWGACPLCGVFAVFLSLPSVQQTVAVVMVGVHVVAVIMELVKAAGQYGLFCVGLRQQR